MEEHRGKKLLHQVRACPELAEGLAYASETIAIARSTPTSGASKRYIYFHGVRHPSEMGDPEVEAFLTHLAIKENVAAPTQNQALSALLFRYREVLPRLHYVYRALPLRRGGKGRCRRQEQHADHHRYENNRPPAQARSASHAPIIPAFTSTVEHNRQKSDNANGAAGAT